MQTPRFFRILGFAALASSAAVAAAHASTRFGLEGGLNAGQLGEHTLLGDGRYWKLGGGLAALVETRVAPGWTFEAAPGWERQVRRLTVNFLTFTGGSYTGYYPTEQSLHFDRLVLPVRASWRPAARHWSLEGGLGPAWIARVERRNESDAIYASPGLAAARGRAATPDAAIFEEVGTFNRIDWTDNFNRWDAVLSGGLGWDVPAGPAAVRVRARWQQGLLDIAKYGEVVRLSSGSFALGLLW